MPAYRPLYRHTAAPIPPRLYRRAYTAAPIHRPAHIAPPIPPPLYRAPYTAPNTGPLNRSRYRYWGVWGIGACGGLGRVGDWGAWGLREGRQGERTEWSAKNGPPKKTASLKTAPQKK